VVLLFHELGHAIHDMVSKTTYARFHGPTGTVVDFGEIPSQLLENWCWTPSQLKPLSRHYSSLSESHLKIWQDKTSKEKKQPATHMPDEMVDSLLKARGMVQALSYLNQLAIAIFDFTIHEPESREAMQQMSIAATYNRLKREIFPLEDLWALGGGDEWSHRYTDFSSFIVSDYHAGYYGYIL
jgi:metallopeptidase MepB